jgi:hypothetical protein
MDYSRNWLYISPEVQKKLGQIKVLVAGTGMGSYFCELAIRTGIQKIIIADGDGVDRSNLNRQNYTTHQLGMNKALATYHHCKSIYPDAELEYIPHYLQASDLERLIPQVDFVINTIDFDAPAFSLCNEIAMRAGKVELFPTNLGFGTSVIAFNQHAASWKDTFTYQDHKELKKCILNHIIQHPQVSPTMREAYVRYRGSHGVAYDPQTGISTFLSAALLTTLIVNFVSGIKVDLFPHFYYLSTEDLSSLVHSHDRLSAIYDERKDAITF